MNEKITSLLLMCLVALSIIYGCGTAFSNHLTWSDGVPSGPTTAAEEPCQDVGLSCPEPNPDIMGDPIDDPTPHSCEH